MFGLEEKEIAAINSVFAKYPNVEKVMLFGSRAKGTNQPFSDIDITMLGDKLTHSDLINIMSDLDDLFLPYEIDLSIFNKINNEALKEHILRMNVVFYSK
ncbi:MAG: nucleotidyltransferase domain-containing protein [Bacteroidales bacterium]|nr:nucleotidyltransferase domain-containing protein [Bacteroidales bacterium]